MAHKKEDVHVVIVGAGVAGISSAIALKTKLGFTNFTVYEQSSGVGGTWKANSYPGCACDIPSHWYSLSTDPNPDWTYIWSPASEILSYWNRLVEKYNIGTHIHFHKKVAKCEWDTDLHAYKVDVQDTQTGTTDNVIAHVVISANGSFLVDPNYPTNIPGREVFKGMMWHSARWNHTYDLKGKRVAVIGSGCSASQLVPVISQDPTTTVVNFIRTANWIVPLPQARYPTWMRWIFKYVPLVMWAHRITICTLYESVYPILWPRSSVWIQKYVIKAATAYMKMMAPSKYHDRLIPKYSPGCKRLVFDAGYLKCLHRPNVELNWDGIASITEGGLVTKKGESLDFDVIVFATGFTSMNGALNVIGAGGRRLQDYWVSKGGPTAYLGTSVPGFPNYFTLFGPNTNTGHASVIFTEEVQINYALRFIKPVVEGKLQSFDVKNEATDIYNDVIQTKLRNTIYMDCISWYRSGEENGKISASYPGTVSHYWWTTLSPRWSDYEMYGVKNWSPSGKLLGFLKALFIL